MDQKKLMPHLSEYNVEKLYKEKLDRIWMKASCSQYHSIIKRGYAIEKKVAEESILFISLNPSFSLSDTAWNNGDSASSVFYDIPLKGGTKNINSFFSAILAFYDSISSPKLPPLAHHDLLFIRETKQETVNAMIKDPNLKSFIGDQVDISKEIIYNSNPKMVVFLNARARDLFKSGIKTEGMKFDSRIGAFIYDLNGRKTPFLFSGMLSGQRALDVGSRESLKWHIEYILRKI